MSRVQDQVRWWCSLTRAEKLEFVSDRTRVVKIALVVPEDDLDGLIERLNRLSEPMPNCEEDDGVST